MIRVALHHKTVYQYDRKVSLGPQAVRLRPAPHCRTPICSYSLHVDPPNHFVNWQQDPHSNYQARIIFPDPANRLEVSVALVAEMTTINPFDFFLEADANEFPFEYPKGLARDLKPFLEPEDAGPELSSFLKTIDRTPIRTIDFLVYLNNKVRESVDYVIRMEPGVQTPEETLSRSSGSCRDSAWLSVQILRHLGLAARFVSGYLIQLKPDVEPLEGPAGAEKDFTDLHAWTEVFLPGAGWIGMDPTSGLLAGEGHIPLACTPEPLSAAPITGTVGECEVQFHHEMSVSRVHEDPRVTKPYSDRQWEEIDRVGQIVDEKLNAGDVRLTMGGEPTFISINDMDADEWNTAAVGPTKRRLADQLIRRLQNRFTSKALIHYGQGKWYPGESLPRWAFTCLWRPDGEPLWTRTDLLADPEQTGDQNIGDAQNYLEKLAQHLGVDPDFVSNAYEDVLYYLWKEQRLAADIDVLDADIDDEEERARLARVFESGLGNPVGCMLPLEHQWWNANPRWRSSSWPVRSDQLFLIPGDSPMGLRLPLDSLPTSSSESWPQVPFSDPAELPDYRSLQTLAAQRLAHGRPDDPGPVEQIQQIQKRGSTQPATDRETISKKGPTGQLEQGDANFVRTALCIEPRDGQLHLFMPPVEKLESFLELLTAVEETSVELNQPIVIEGYLPPPDPRLEQIKVTPDPGVIEVNVHPTESWKDLVDVTRGLYDEARLTKLGTEKFDTDGTHTGTGGGNHVVMGARTPEDSPFLRRPDLLRSLIGYWHNHPSLSYLFSGKFIGPTSQAPRVDEGRRDAIYELEIAFDQVPDSGKVPPWLVDRVFRHLLVDLTGNTHRAEFCIDKLYSPDSPTGRLGLVEFRAFEMPPHWQMSLTQQLLLRALVARFWEQPYRARLVDWNTTIHDRWLLPHFLKEDFRSVIDETSEAGFPMEENWFAPHFEFRFPKIGEADYNGIKLELRTAIEPWYVLGEEPAAGGTARYVDSSVERIQVKATGLTGDRHMISCNGRKLPLHPTGVEGEYVAGIRFRAWQPPSCLHPTLEVDHPLILDIIDTWQAAAVGGCQYHIGHPGGLNPDSIPVNALEAESRRAARFFDFGHTCGPIRIPDDEFNPTFPMTLDLRRNRK